MPTYCHPGLQETRIFSRLHCLSLLLLTSILLPSGQARPSSAWQAGTSSRSTSAQLPHLENSSRTSQRHLTSLPRHPGRHEPRNLQDGLKATAEPQFGSRSGIQHPADHMSLESHPDGDGLRAAGNQAQRSQPRHEAQQDSAGLSQGELISQEVYDEESAALNQPQHASIGHHLIAQADTGGDEVLHGEHRHLASAEPVQSEAGTQLLTSQEAEELKEALPLEDKADAQPAAAQPIRLVACAQLKNEVPYVVEWIEFHRLVGFSHLIIYDDFSTDNMSLLDKLYR